MTGGILALDLGTQHTAWAYGMGRNTRPVWGKVSFAKAAKDTSNPDGAVLVELRDWLTMMAGRYFPAWIGAERPWIPQPRTVRIGKGITAAAQALPLNQQTISRLHGMFGVVAMVSRERGLRWAETTTWAVEKHFLGKSGHPSAEKKRLTQQLCQTIGWTPVTQDEADALAVLSYMETTLLPQAYHRATGALLAQKKGTRR